ncbi:MAG: DUF2490 domain-containing protein [Novosphingobium sp.]|uniref:DUF2490 domain-containing protein n=1 Tax=Novosphingobium sp. TaxID=1874826 RepID=UPI003C7B6FD7
MRTIVKPLLFAAACGLATPALADDTQYWQTVTVNVALPDNFKIQNETVLRTSGAKGFYELENNVMVGKKVSKVTTLWLGYTFDPQYSHGTFTRREHRFRQQINFDGFAVVGKVKFSGRVRLEERWREGLPGTAWRLRPQVKASLPITGKVTLSVASEPFINLNNTGFQTADGLDRMRNSISVGVPLSKRVTLDFGYLNQHGFVSGGPDTDDHVLTTGISASF